jgi:hypothetical protein
MRILFVAAITIILGPLAPFMTQAQELSRDTITEFSKAFRFFLVLEKTENAPLRYMYADTGPHLHVFSIEDGNSVLQWESTNLGSPITALFVKDVLANGKKSIILATAKGRFMVYDADSYEFISENFHEPFNSISCLTLANIDNDPQDEIIFIGDKLLNIYDSTSRALVWRSQDEFTADEILVANVDDDVQPEIILNSGQIIDSRFYSLERVNLDSGSFGSRMRLLDVNGDGFPEIIGETKNYALQVYDVYAQRIIW